MNVNLRTQNILLIEDYPAMRLSIKEMFLSADAQHITEADNAEKALLAMEKIKYNIVLCDYNLGEGKNGQQLLEEAKFRKLLPYSAIFIIVTAEQTQSMVLSVMDNKPDEYLAKPFNAQQLLSRIQKQMVRKRYFASIEQAIDRDNLYLAIQRCEALLREQDPKMRTQLLKTIAELSINVGDFKAASAYYQEVLNHRELAWARLGLGVVEFLEGRLDAAVAVFNEVIKQAPMMMESYDWLTKAYQAMGKRQEAQATLNLALELSPQAILRQQELAILAETAGDNVVAEKAYKSAIELGHYSVYKSCRDFSGLAKVYSKTNNPKAALKLIADMNESFKKSPEAELRAAHMEVAIHQNLGDKVLVEKAYAKLRNISDQRQMLPKDLLLDIAETHFVQDNSEAGKRLINDLIRNQVDDESFIYDLLRRLKMVSTQEFYRQAEVLYHQVKQELVTINNQGVTLFQQGKLQEALALLNEAHSKVPNNKTIIMNLAKIMIYDMKMSGITKEKLLDVKSCIDKAIALGVSKDKTGSIKMQLLKLSHARTSE